MTLIIPLTAFFFLLSMFFLSYFGIWTGMLLGLGMAVLALLSLIIVLKLNGR